MSESSEPSELTAPVVCQTFPHGFDARYAVSSKLLI